MNKRERVTLIRRVLREEIQRLQLLSTQQANQIAQLKQKIARMEHDQHAVINRLKSSG